MVKTIAYIALHYGRDYLASAIRSVIDAVDEYHVLYTPVGSHGHRTGVPCPETRDELYEIARKAAGNKFYWHEATWDYEGQQRDAIHQIVPDADVVLVVDADEIWDQALVYDAVMIYDAAVKGYKQTPTVRRYRTPMFHYWRSFHRAVIHDPACPVRFIFPKMPEGEETYTAWRALDDSMSHVSPLAIHHFGYAQRPEIVEYKQLTHGHKGEWRRDMDWFHDKFMANAQIDCHPVGSDAWNPEPVDPFALGLPEWMRQHPYAQLQVIE